MSTLERQVAEADIRNKDAATETARYIAHENVRQKDVDLQRLEAERQDAVRAGDLDRVQALDIERDRQLLARQTLTGWIGGDGGISNLGALLWIPSRKTERVHPGGTPLNRACPSLLQDVSGLMSPSLLPSSSWRCIAK
jgi:hypothetical protein